MIASFITNLIKKYFNRVKIPSKFIYSLINGPGVAEIDIENKGFGAVLI